MHRSKLSGVLHKGFKPDKCKIALKMAMARIKLLRNKKEAQVRQMRREVAQLLDGNQDQTARIRVRLRLNRPPQLCPFNPPFAFSDRPIGDAIV
jgi:hypothetical protein